MGALPGLLPLVLGGTQQPYIINLLPAEDAQNVRVVDPIRFSIKDTLLALNAGTLRAVVGYAKTRSNGTAFFDEQLPRTSRVTLFPPSNESVAPSFAVVGSGVQITKTSGSPQRSVYASRVDLGDSSSRESAIVTALLRPDVQTNNAEGAVLGLEYGPRNTGVYVFFQVVAGVKTIRITGPRVNGLRVPNVTHAFDWTGLNRYIIFWNENASPATLEVFADVGGVLTPFSTIPISTFQQLDPSQSNSTPILRMGGGDVVGIYGQEGANGDQVTIKNIAVAVDVGFPILSGVKRGEFITQQKADHLVHLPGDFDPRVAPIAPWFDPPTPLFPTQDAEGSITALPNKVLRFSKPTAGEAFSVYREDPGLLRMGNEGFFLETLVKLTPTVKDVSWTGAGFLFSDTANVYQVSFFDDAINRLLGLRKKNGVESEQLDHFLTTNIDWSSTVGVRFVADPRRGLIEIFNQADLLHPIMSVPFDRMQLPTIADYGYANTDLPFLAVGFPRQSQATGEMELSELSYSYHYQAYEPARDLLLPTAANPVFSTGAMSGTASVTPGGLTLTTDGHTARSFERTVSFDQTRGMAVEFELAIPTYTPNADTGVYLGLLDGSHVYGLGFTEVAGQKFVGFFQEATGSFPLKMVVGVDGDAAKLSFLLDWSQAHHYRIDRQPNDRVEIFVDGELKLVLLDREVEMPPSGDPAALAFGVRSGVGVGVTGTVSVWRYIRTFSGGGYEISTKKDLDVKALRESLFDTQAVVLVTVSD